MQIKKVLTSFCIIIPLFLVIIYYSIGSFESNTVTTNEKIYEIYLLAFEQGGFSGTYEDWLNEINGDELEIRITGTELQWKYKKEDDTNWVSLYDISVLEGEDGLSAFDIWKVFKNDDSLTLDDFFQSLNVYNLWLAQPGNDGKTIEDFFDSLKGEDGANGQVDVKALYPVYVSFGYQKDIDTFLNEYNDGSLGGLKNLYTVSFDVSGVVSNCSVYDGELVDSIIDPTSNKEGYEFTGWYYNDKEWLFDFYTVKQDITLEAKFEAIEYVISFDLGENANYYPGSITMTIDDTFTLPEPLKTGYSFVKWTEGNSDISSVLENINRDMNLVAEWEEVIDANNKNTVTFVVGEDEYLTESIVFGGKVSQPDTPPVPSGYVFDGWFYGDERWSFIGYSVTEDITLTANFKLIQYSIEYMNLEINENSYFNKTSATIADGIIRLYDASRIGYEFDGWSLTQNGEIVTEFDCSNISSEVLIYANWTLVVYEVRYEFDGETIIGSYDVESNNEIRTVFDGKEYYEASKFINKFTGNEVSKLSPILSVGGTIFLQVVEFSLRIYDNSYVYLEDSEGEYRKWYVVSDISNGEVVVANYDIQYSLKSDYSDDYTTESTLYKEIDDVIYPSLISEGAIDEFVISEKAELINENYVSLLPSDAIVVYFSNDTSKIVSRNGDVLFDTKTVNVCITITIKL